MKSVTCLPVLLAFATVIAPVCATAADQRSRTREENRSKTETIVGVVDQKGGTFIISGEEQMHPIAKLRGVGFSEDNFARFVGMKVRITGEMVAEGDSKVLIVRRLNDIVQTGPEESKKK